MMNLQEIALYVDLPAGTVVKMGGIPVEITTPFTILTTSSNWKLIREWEDKMMRHVGEE